jgi:L-alanine-DL-glutamate epimerase-like enolase superfamily enzyme
MKITGVRTTLYEVELTRLLGDANSPSGRSRAAQVAVFLDTDEGLTGIGVGAPGARGHIHSYVDNLLSGSDPRGVRGLWQRMVDFVFKGGNSGIASDAICALDMALWDLKAKAAGEPLWRLLGASSGRVKAYASGIDLPLSDDEIGAFYTRMAGLGISAGKLKVGIEREADLRRLQIMHDALAMSGKKPALMIDSNEYWSPKQAIRHISFFESHFELVWAEEPARRWDYQGLRKVSESVNAAIATGENLDNIGDFMPLIANQAVDIVQVGIGTTGLTGAMQVAHMAHGFELPVAMMNCPANYMAHLAACLPNHMMMEVVDVGMDACMISDQHVEDGWIVLGDSPGFGLSFDENSLAAAAVEAPSKDAGASPWGRREGAGLYEVGLGEEQTRT